MNLTGPKHTHTHTLNGRPAVKWPRLFNFCLEFGQYFKDRSFVKKQVDFFFFFLSEKGDNLLATESHINGLHGKLLLKPLKNRELLMGRDIQQREHIILSCAPTLLAVLLLWNYIFNAVKFGWRQNWHMEWNRDPIPLWCVFSRSLFSNPVYNKHNVNPS